MKELDSKFSLDDLCLNLIENLVESNEPILSVYNDLVTNDIWFKAVPKDDFEKKVELFCRVESENVYFLLNNEISIRNIFLSSYDIYIVIHENGNKEERLFVYENDKKYLPSPDELLESDDDEFLALKNFIKFKNN